MAKKKILIASIARNIADTFETDYKIILNSFQDFEIIKWVIVESNSSDSSKTTLSKFELKDSIVEFHSLENSNPNIPRTVALANARNKYLKIFEGYQKKLTIDYLVVYDMNNLNNQLTVESVRSCFARKDWAAVTANQNGPYYDIYALRHEYWNPSDCWETYDYLKILHNQKFRFVWDTALWDSVYSKMIRIKKVSDWVLVDSAFGGVAIYKSKYISGVRYKGTTSTGKPICEHVYFNRGIQKLGGKIYINPSFINFKYTDHSYRKKYFVFFNIKYYLRKVITFSI